MRARLLCLLVLVVALTGIGSAASTAHLALDPPVPGQVLARFDAPSRYGPGHRGVDLAAPLGSPVHAAAAGRVTFAGRVVGAAWVTVDHGALRTTVGPLATVQVRRGDRVGRGTVLGSSGRAHGRAAVHWSARRGDTYVDPLGAGRVVATLLPSAGAATTRSWWPRGRAR